MACPFLIPRLIRGRYKGVVSARLGFKSSIPVNVRGAIWVHALSVGEVRSAAPVIQALRERFSDIPLVFSTATGQGFDIARELYSLRDDVHIMIRPLDVPWAVGRTVRDIQPVLSILVDGDIWPGWQWEMGQKRVPRLLVNGRVSPRTFRGYQRFRSLAYHMLDGFEQILVQSDMDRQRLLKVGLAPDKVAVGGNLKFDSNIERLSSRERNRLRIQLGLSNRSVLVAGSTHDDEEESILNVFKTLAGKHTGLILILAPRRLERGAHLAKLAARMGFQTVRLSQGPADNKTEVLVLDRLGLLARVYAVAKAAFVGGSWVDVGGHNLLEPAVQAIPQAFGPVVYNFREMADRLMEAGGGVCVLDAAELTAIWDRWLSDSEGAAQVGTKASAFAQTHRGAVQQVLQHAVRLMQLTQSG